MNTKILLSLGVLLASIMAVATGGESPVRLMAQVSSIVLTPTPVYSVTQPREIRQGESYTLDVRVTGGAQNTPVVLHLMRPNGSFKYSDQDDVLARIASRTTDSQGNWNSPRITQTIDADAPAGVYTSWVVVGGVASNKVTHEVLPLRGNLLSFSAEPNSVASGEAVTFEIRAVNISQFKLRLTCPAGVTAKTLMEEYTELDLCTEQVLPGHTKSLTAIMTNADGAAKRVSSRLSAYDARSKIVGIKIERVRVSPLGEIPPIDPTSDPVATSSSRLLITLDPSTPSARLVTGGSQDIPLTVLSLTALDEDVSLQSIGLQLGEHSSAAAMVKATLWDGPVKLGEAVFAANSQSVTLTLVTHLIIPKGGSKLLTIKGNFAAIGTGQLASAGDALSVDFDADRDGTRAVGATSGLPVAKTAEWRDTAAAPVYLFKSQPTVAKLPVPTATLSNGTMTLYRFSVAADAAGDIGLGKVTFIVLRQGARVSGLALHGYADSRFSVQAYYANPLNFPTLATAAATSTELSVYFNPLSQLSGSKEALQIPAGTTRYFELRGVVTKDASNAGLEVMLAGDAVKPPVSFLDAVDQLEADNFIWSGNSTTTSSVQASDWANGYVVAGLPSGGLPAAVFGNGVPVALALVTGTTFSNTPGVVSSAFSVSASADPLKFQMPSRAISGESVSLSIAADPAKIARLELTLRCPESVSVASAETKGCSARAISIARKEYELVFSSADSLPQAVIATLRGYDATGSLIATRFAALTVQPLELDVASDVAAKEEAVSRADHALAAAAATAMLNELDGMLFYLSKLVR